MKLFRSIVALLAVPMAACCPALAGSQLYVGAGFNIVDGAPASDSIHIIEDAFFVQHVVVTLDFGPSGHPACGQLIATLQRGTTTIDLFNRIGTDAPAEPGTGSQFTGVYSFADNTNNNLWGTAQKHNPVTPGTYRAATNDGSSLNSPPNGPFVSIDGAFAGGSVPAGDWILTIQDDVVDSVGGVLAGWSIEFFDEVSGACCFSTLPCLETTKLQCLNAGGIYRGDNSLCAGTCDVPPPLFVEPPPPGHAFTLDQITNVVLDGNTTDHLSQQFAPPPALDNRNTGYVDEFTIGQTTVITRLDTLMRFSGTLSIEPPGGFLLSIWPSGSAAAVDLTLQNNTVYNQGYTVPILLRGSSEASQRGGGEYEPIAGVLSNGIGVVGLRVYINPSVSRGASTTGLILGPGTYYVAMSARADSSWGQAGVIDSYIADPRLPAPNGFQVNAGGGILPEGIPQSTGAQAAYRIVGRHCMGDITGDGLVGTHDLVALLGDYGNPTSPGNPSDFNADGVIDILDLGDLLGHFGQACQ